MSYDITTLALYTAAALVTFDVMLVGVLWKLDVRGKLAQLG